MLKMSYAVKNGTLIHVSEVESGLKCGCTCPACNARLVARKGSIKEHHFAHAKDEDCQKGTETVLHIMAKSILEKEKYIRVPKVYVLTKFTAVHYQGHDFPRNKQEYASGEMYIKFDRVELEKRVDDFVPDVALYSGNQCLLAEIKVSHGIDEDKLQKIRSSDISVLEIDLSAMNGTITESELRDLLIENVSKKKWIYNKKAEYYRKEWLNLCDKLQPLRRENIRTEYEAYRYHYIINDCPQNKRIHNGRPYANIKTDCFPCEYCINIEYADNYLLNEIDRITYVYCCGRNKISSVKELRDYTKSKKKL
ncbi:MAG: hypothetical protein FWD71_21915 [Oscillospiraceae bacterium]|nr:hypothetical protein [Oscillospiraceae bacterium]